MTSPRVAAGAVRASCPRCGWRGEWQTDPRSALADLNEHRNDRPRCSLVVSKLPTGERLERETAELGYHRYRALCAVCRRYWTPWAGTPIAAGRRIAAHVPDCPALPAGDPRHFPGRQRPIVI